MTGSDQLTKWPWMIWLFLKLKCRSSRIFHAIIFLINFSNCAKAIAYRILLSNAERLGYMKYESNQWLIDSKLARHVARQLHVFTHLDTTEDAAMFTMTMGELAALHNSFPIHQCRDILSKCPGFLDHDAVFQIIGELAATHYPRAETNLESQGLAQSVNNCGWNAESFQFAHSFSDQPHTFNNLWRYGLALGMCIAAPLDFRAFGQWLFRQTDSAIICPSLRLIEDFYHADDNTTLELLKSGHPFLQLIGIATINASQYVGHDIKWRHPLERSIELAEQAGISREDVVWTAFDRIEDVQRSAERAKRQVDDHRTHAPADADRALALESSCASLQSQLVREMEVLAQHWPLEGISEDKAKSLLKLQRGQLTLALSVAEMLRPESRKSLLKVIVAEFHSQSAIFEPPNDTTPYSEPYAWRERLPQAARAFALLHEGNDVGRKLGSLAESNDQLLFPLACQPYLSHRRHNCWTHVFGKLGLLYLYAVEVAYESERLDATDGSEFLAEYVTKQALELLKHYQGGGWFSTAFGSLSRRCA